MTKLRYETQLFELTGYNCKWLKCFILCFEKFLRLLSSFYLYHAEFIFIYFFLATCFHIVDLHVCYFSSRLCLCRRELFISFCNEVILSTAQARALLHQHASETNKGGKFLQNLWCCIGGEYYKIIWFYRLG